MTTPTPIQHETGRERRKPRVVVSGQSDLAAAVHGLDAPRTPKNPPSSAITLRTCADARVDHCGANEERERQRPLTGWSAAAVPAFGWMKLSSAT